MPRIDIPGLTYHVTNRGVKKMAIFHDDDDRQHFMRLILATRQLFPFTLQSFSLMTNHFHLLIKTANASLSQLMQYVTGRYAIAFNRKYGLMGHTFQSRFHSLPVQTDRYLLAVSRYIDLNAVRVGIVDQPQNYPWCSYAYLARGERNPYSDPEEVLAMLSEDAARARQRYMQFVADGLTQPELITQEKLLKMRSWGARPVLVQNGNPME